MYSFCEFRGVFFIIVLFCFSRPTDRGWWSPDVASSPFRSDVRTTTEIMGKIIGSAKKAYCFVEDTLLYSSIHFVRWRKLNFNCFKGGVTAGLMNHFFGMYFFSGLFWAL